MSLVIEPVVWTDEMVRMVEAGLEYDRVQRVLHMHHVWSGHYDVRIDPEEIRRARQAPNARYFALDQALPSLPQKPSAPQMITMRDALDYWLAHRKPRP